ncbi:MAG: tetratricopeptide repeat protein [Oligoflexia bacterium]|nr:tetratricopeptide repeat protein [Oligoflexia bacterium]
MRLKESYKSYESIFLFFIQILSIFSLIFFSSCDFSSKLNREILQAQEYYHKQEYTKSVERYEDILKKDPPASIKAKIYFQLGELYSIHLGRYRDGVKYFLALKDETDDPSWMLKVEDRIGDINYSFLRDYNGAINNYTKLVKYIPAPEKHDMYEFRLAKSYMEVDRRSLALEIFQKIYNNQKHEFHIEACFEIGLLYYEMKKWEDALKYWSKYIEIEKRKDKIAWVKFLIANTYETLEKLEEAYEMYYSILGEYPNTEVIKERLKAIYNRKIKRRR